MTKQRQNILVTVDTVILMLLESKLHVLLVQRAEPPFAGQWALPGGIVEEAQDATLEATAYRKLCEKTGVGRPYLEQVMTVGSLDRDPRGYSVSVLYMALLRADAVDLRANKRVSEVAWVPAADCGVDRSLAFDHAELLRTACLRLRSKAEYSSLVAHLLPAEFTLSELREAYDSVLGLELNPAAFRRRVMQANLLEEVPGRFRYGSTRPAQIYRLHPEAGKACFETNLSARLGEGR